MRQQTTNALTIAAFCNAVIFILAVAVSIHWLEGDRLVPLWWSQLIPLLWLTSVAFSATEFMLHGSRDRAALQTLALVVLLPPFRLAVVPAKPGCSWLPGLGWCEHDRVLFRRLERAFAAPMIVIAGLMLPIVAVELFWPALTERYWVQLAMNIGAGGIWMAFTVEFIILFSISGEKLKYCLRHWLDLIIIVLPLISYLRTLRLLKLGKIARTLRAYRMRSLTTKLFQGATTADLLGLILRRSREKQIDHLQQRIELHREEIDDLQAQIDTLRETGEGER
ncbi:MAG: bZIP transcription factor [Gammaproteobacteria bacterium]|nr:bZIP transcription factor [Gammaproteobacteria bacterium]